MNKKEKDILEEYLDTLGVFTFINCNGHSFSGENERSQHWLRQDISRAAFFANLLRSFRSNLTDEEKLTDIINRHKNGEIIPLGYHLDTSCWICGLKPNFVTLQGTVLSPLHRDYHTPGDHNPEPLEICPMDPTIPYEIEINIPSGEMIVANHLRDLFPERADEEKYGNNSINFLYGRKKHTEHYAKFGYGEFNIGNCACDMFPVNGSNSNFIVGSYECSTEKQIADVCTDFWGFGITDHQLAISLGLEKFKKDHSFSDFDIVTCKSGRYKFSHRYHLCNDESTDIYTHIDWIGPVK